MPGTITCVSIYVDGSIFASAARPGTTAAQLSAWLHGRSHELVTTQAARTELRALVAADDVRVRTKALQLVSLARMERLSDQALGRSSEVAEVLGSYAAMHLGAARAMADVDSLATFDPALAQAAEYYGLRVLAPGRSPRWYAA